MKKIYNLVAFFLVLPSIWSCATAPVEEPIIVEKAPIVEEEPTVETVKETLPTTYTVIGRSKNTDSLWKISGYDFIYDNPTKWETIYEENRSTMPQPDNPNLIIPGQVLLIPRLNEESQAGNNISNENINTNSEEPIQAIDK